MHGVFWCTGAAPWLRQSRGAGKIVDTASIAGLVM